MKLLESRILWGVLLIVGGVMFLLQNMGLFEFGDLFWALLLGLAGVFFLSVFSQNRANWWAIIPGFILLGIATSLVLEKLLPNLGIDLSGLLVLGSLGLSFLVIYLVDRENWWAIIPAGVLLTLGVISLLDESSLGIETGGIFFLGLGLTFALVALLPNPHGQMKWAWIPAGVLALMGILFIAAAGELINYIWPAVLILAGGFMIVRTFLPHKSDA